MSRRLRDDGRQRITLQFQEAVNLGPEELESWLDTDGERRGALGPQ